MFSFRYAVAATILTAWSLSCGLSAIAAEVKPDVRVMSFNVRYGTANDGVNRWELRRDFLVETIRTFSPDLLGTQETLGFQRDYLATKLPEYDYLGIGRDDGRERGEMMALYFRKDRFEKLDGGHFWLSETPDVIGSKSWDSSLPRMVTWVKLRDRRQEALPPIVFFNTHFDHMGTTARLESAKLLRRKIAALCDTCSVIVTGDFNTDEASPPYRALFDAVDSVPSPVVDSYRANRPDRLLGKEGTFSSFKADAISGARIDWIGVSRDWQIRSTAIDHTARAGRTPSDHFPVTAILRRKAASQKERQHVVSAPQFGGDYDVESHLNIPYYDGADADQRKHKLDLFIPKGIKDFPVLFFVHGGAWTTGDRKLYSYFGKVFARNGIGTVVTSYRLSPRVKHPAHIEDVARAFAWTHKNIAKYGGRTDRIFVTGQSAGGHLSALLCTDARYLQAHGLTLKAIHAAIPISGIYTFRPNEMALVVGWGEAAAANASPINHVSGDEPPFLILLAQSDIPRCDQMSNDLRDSLVAKGISAECLTIPDRNHLTIIFQMALSDSDRTAQAILSYIAKHSELKLGPRTAKPQAK